MVTNDGVRHEFPTLRNVVFGLEESAIAREVEFHYGYSDVAEKISSRRYRSLGVGSRKISFLIFYFLEGNKLKDNHDIARHSRRMNYE